MVTHRSSSFSPPLHNRRHTTRVLETHPTLHDNVSHVAIYHVACQKNVSCSFIEKPKEWAAQRKTQRRDVAIRCKTLAAYGPLVRVRVCAVEPNGHAKNNFNVTALREEISISKNAKTHA